MRTKIITDSVKGKNFEMDYCRFGNGKRVMVLLPGISLLPVVPNGEFVAMQYHLFHDDYTVYLFDRKRDFDDNYDVEAMADDTAEAMQLLGIEKACVMGCSQGGMMTLFLAAKYPEMVEKAALCCTAACADDCNAETMQRMLEIAKTGDVQALNHAFFEAIYSEPFREKNAQALKVAEQIGTEEDLPHFIKLANACMNYDARPLLPQIKCDCLVLGSAIDKVIKPEASQRLVDALGCESYIYTEYAHAAFDEAPDFKARVLEFFGK